MNRKGWVGQRPGARALSLAMLAVGTVLLTPSLRADDTAPRAARLSFVDGPVRIAQDGQTLADPALVNAPLFEGAQVVTSDNGRAELEFDDGSVARLSPDSSLTLTVLRGEPGSGDTEINLDGGLAYFELQGAGAGSQVRVRFGQTVATTDGFTVLRINMDNPPGELAVFSGNAHVERGHAMALDMHGGESVALNASDQSQYILSESIEPDSWDTWNSDRDQELTSLAAEKTGAENNLPENNNPAWNDLDANGNWYNVPGQGSVWSPYDASNPEWDPYGNGYWMWTPRFGYIWVSGESWGYMPFQCGAWNFYNDFGWGWAPGLCQPWWGGGGGWLLNIGSKPLRYHPPLRPHPVPPRRLGGQPMKGGLAALPGNAVIPVSRHESSGADTLPTRDRNSVVTIGGHPVQALSPVRPRPQYERANAGQVNRPDRGDPRATLPAGQKPSSGFVSGNSRQAYTPPARRPDNGQPARTPQVGAPGNNRPVNPPAQSSSSRGSAPAPSHPSSGGGSQPSHSSSGGGGGGGGSHSGGGGGGGGSNNSGGSGRH